MPVEVMARRGKQTLCYGPLKPPGPPGPEDGAGALRRGAAAPGQRRREHLQLGGLSDPPDLAGAEAGVLHDPRAGAGGVRPLWGDAPKHLPGSPRLLDRYYRVRTEPRIVFAGQITGVEGYVESTASGCLAALELARELEGKGAHRLSPETALGALALYVSNETVEHFQPMNINFGIMPPWATG